MISAPIYLFTLRRVAKNYVMYLVGAAFMFLVPIAGMVETTPSPVHLDPASSYTCALLFGLTLIVSQNVAGSVSSQSGGSDYLPLILSRPITRATFIFSKLLALTTLILMVSLPQFFVLNIIQICAGHAIVPAIFACSFLERLLDTFSISIALVLISLLPTRQMFGFGIIFLELLGLNRLAFDFDFYTPAGSDMLIDSLNKAGLIKWLDYNVIWHLPFRECLDAMQGIGALLATALGIIAPRIYVFDFLTNASFDWLPLFNYLFNISAGLMLCLAMINNRDFNYAAE